VAVKGGKDTLVARIALDGGEEIKRELAQLGVIGEVAFKRLKAAADATGGAHSTLGRFVADTRAHFQRVAIAAANARQRFNDVGDAASTVAKRVAIAGTAVVALGVGILAFVNSAVRAGSEAHDMAQQLGVTTEEFGGLKFAAQQSGIEVDVFSRVFARFQKSAADSARDAAKFANELDRVRREGIASGKDYTQIQREVTAITENAAEAALLNSDAIKKLGINVGNAETGFRSSLQVLEDVAEVISKMPDGIAKTNLVMEIFGARGGPKLAALLNEGRKGIRAMIADAKFLGGTFTKTQAIIADKAGDAFGRLTTAIKGTRDQFGLLFAPAQTAGANALANIIAENRGRILEFGAAIRDFVKPILDDLILLMQGRDQDVKLQWVLDAKNAVVLFGQTVAGVFNNVIKPIFDGIVAVLDLVASTFNRVFGTELTGQQIAFALIIAQVTGVLGLFVTAIQAVIAIGILMVATFTPVGLLIVAIGIALGLLAAWIANNWPQIKETLTNAFTGAVDTIKGALNSVFNFVVDVFNRMTAPIVAFINLVRRAIDWVKQLFAAKAQAGPAASVGGFARGGRVRGRGTSTSDSILALLSNNEFVVNAKAVGHYGVDFMRALNSMQLPKGFSMGGLASALGHSLRPLAMPRFAVGGLALARAGGGGRPVTLNIGGETFNMTASDDVAESLSRFAIKRRTRSLGRKPNWAGT